MKPSKIKELAVPTLRLSKPANVDELHAVLVTLTEKLNEVIVQTNAISEYLRK